jgi:hypothetical protein
MIAQTVNGFANRMSVAKDMSLRQASASPGEFPIAARPLASELSSVFLPQDASMRAVAADGHGQCSSPPGVGCLGDRLPHRVALLPMRLILWQSTSSRGFVVNCSAA